MLRLSINTSIYVYFMYSKYLILKLEQGHGTIIQFLGIIEALSSTIQCHTVQLYSLNHEDVLALRRPQHYRSLPKKSRGE